MADKAGQRGGDLSEGVHRVAEFAAGPDIGPTIAAAERRLMGRTRTAASQEVTLTDLLPGAILVARSVGDIYALIHAAGMLMALPYILGDEERIETISLGAGATGEPDLVTTERIAEFKFQRWKGNDGARKRELLGDVMRLSLDDSGRPRFLYLVDAVLPRRWLTTSPRALLAKVGGHSRHAAALAAVQERFGLETTGVSQFWHLIDPPITIVPLAEVCPPLAALEVPPLPEEIDPAT